ncbi:MAG TPA: pyruvate kinase [Candidatus Saccharimonadales bacterium]|nr:pyruvate kinase [Candidatus Saccharimonadales bacterium]
MNATTTAPGVPLASFKRVKIMATVGPATNDFDQIRRLIKEGANGLRLNCSHGTNEERDEQIAWIRRAAAQCGKPVAIIQDLQGPKIRLGDFDGVVTVQKGQGLSFKYTADYAKTGHIPTQYDLSKKVKRGERLFLYDGKVKTVVTSVREGVVYVRAENDGILIKRKGMNLPDTDFGGDVITAKDKADLAYGSTKDIDYVAMSFVQTADDILNLRRRMKNLGFNAKIIAKIETKAAVENIESIVDEADVVMIARGDLAVETPAESVPIVQRQIIGLGLKYGKPTIVATQMMASMTEAPDPTRAEVSDVATAVLVGADCVMLSDETANGKYPIEAVKIMKRVIKYSEGHAPLKAVFHNHPNDATRQTAIAEAVVSLAKTVQAKAIVAETKSGATALQLAALRTDVPLIAVTDEVRTAQQLAIVYGAKSYVRPSSREAAIKLTNWLLKEKVLKKGDIVVTASGQYPGVVGTTDTIKVRMLE